MSKSKVKATILERFGAECYYCKHALTVQTATIDHFVPRRAARGVPFNKRPSCVVCNRMKGGLPFEQFRKRVFRLALQFILHPFMGGRYDYSN